MKTKKKTVRPRRKKFGTVLRKKKAKPAKGSPAKMKAATKKSSGGFHGNSHFFGQGYAIDGRLACDGAE